MSKDDTINQAKKWEFTISQNDQDQWQILPSNSEENWSLVNFEDLWLLTVKDVPQTYLTDQQAVNFLKMRRYPGLSRRHSD